MARIIYLVRNLTEKLSDDASTFEGSVADPPWSKQRVEHKTRLVCGTSALRVWSLDLHHRLAGSVCSLDLHPRFASSVCRRFINYDRISARCAVRLMWMRNNCWGWPTLFSASFCKEVSKLSRRAKACIAWSFARLGTDFSTKQQHYL